jgi:chromosome segregation ATPase
MNPVNYQETIVIPVLQKKVQDLQINNLFLEVSLMVEQAKVKDIENFYKTQSSSVDSIKKELELKESRIVDLKTQLNNLNEDKTVRSASLSSLESELKREKSVNESILSEYRTLKIQYDELLAEYNNFKSSLEPTKSVDTSVKTSINMKKVKDKQI